MNQGAHTQTLAHADPSSVEGRYVVNSQGHASSYVPSTTGSEAASWTRHQVDNYSIENGVISNSNYHHGQQAELTKRNGHDGMSATSVGSSSSSATTVTPQEYSDYSVYSTSMDPYACGGAGYPSYYSGYQHQPKFSHLHQQPNNPYTLQQPNHSYSQQQPSHSFSQPVGAYQNTGAPYQPISSFQNSGSYAGTTSYSTTYYNPGDYQTAGGYPSSGYSNQSTSWNDANYTSYASQQYPSYTANATSAYNSSATSATSATYQQHYKQWADYYSQTEVTCAPGTEHLSVASTSNQGSSLSGATGGYITPSSYTTPYSEPWRPESTSYGLPSLQTGLANTVAHDNAWKQGTPNVSDNHATPLQPQFQKYLDTKSTYDNFQEQQKISPQVPNLQYPAAHQVSQSYQSPVQSLPPLDARRVSKLQIPTNPRIAPSLTLCLSKTEEGGTAMAAVKPAYISVSLPKPNDKVNAADSMLKPGTFPKSLRDYVERAFRRCSDDRQMAACQAIMKDLITKASADGTLYTRDWDTEPLFPLPDLVLVNKDNSETVPSVASLPKNKRSPSKRPKSRWEPLPEEKSVDKTISVGNHTVKYNVWDRKPFIVNSGSKNDVLSSIKFAASDQKTPSRTAHKPVKRPHLADGIDVTDNGDTSSDSDKEQSLTAYSSGAIALANNPEEKRRRESRSKRFEKAQGNRAEITYFKPKNVGVASLYGRRASSLMLSKNFDDDGSRAVEDFDWDSLTVKGTCQEIEKRYLRLTSTPDPSTVRPEDVLEKALLMVQDSQKNYLYKCDQLKSIRQDLTVQRIQNRLTVKVYETHARLALEVGDLPEYNQCQSQLKTLYAEGIEGCHMEFAAYNLLCVILHSNNNRDLLSSMSRLTEEAKKDEAVKHAIAVRAAVNSGNYVMFFRLYKTSPNLNSCLMDLCVEKIRYKAVSCMARAYRPTVPVSYISKILGFSSNSEENSEKDSDSLGECMEWLKAHGACLITDDNGEMQFDAKASSSSLYKPEPEDAVAHGDASLAVNDFLTRTSL